MIRYTKPKINWNYVLISAVAVFFTWIFHESAHWVVGEYLGYDMGLQLNASYPVSGQYDKDLHEQVISAAGPVFTLCEAIIVFLLMTQQRRILLYPFLFTCFYMRLFAMIMSFLNPNDEARISSYLGIGKFTLPLIVTVILFLLLYKTSKSYKLDTKFNLANLGLVMFFSSIIILADMFFKVRLI